jgi:hypothetical protein
MGLVNQINGPIWLFFERDETITEHNFQESEKKNIMKLMIN